jgi:hypothetical protein
MVKSSNMNLMKYVAVLAAVITALMANYLYDAYQAGEKRESEAYAARQEADPINVRIFKETKAKAETGDADAQHSLGYQYSEGRGVAKDIVLATEWWRTSAMQGNARAQTTLALLYTENDKGVKKNLVEAAKLFRMAARQSDPLSLQVLADCYQNGNGVVRDDIEAYAYYALSSIRFGGKCHYQEKLEKEMTREQIEAGLKRAKELQKEIKE